MYLWKHSQGEKNEQDIIPSKKTKTNHKYKNKRPPANKNHLLKLLLEPALKKIRMQSSFIIYPTMLNKMYYTSAC